MLPVEPFFDDQYLTFIFKICGPLYALSGCFNAHSQVSEVYTCRLAGKRVFLRILPFYDFQLIAEEKPVVDARISLSTVVSRVSWLTGLQSCKHVVATIQSITISTISSSRKRHLIVHSIRITFVHSMNAASIATFGCFLKLLLLPLKELEHHPFLVATAQATVDEE